MTLEVIVRPLLARLMSVDSPSINPDMAAAFDTLEQLSTLSRKTQADLGSLLDNWKAGEIVSVRPILAVAVWH